MPEKKTEDLIRELRADGYSVPNAASQRETADAQADEAAAIRLLSGYCTDSGANVDFPEHRSADEQRDRAALARLVRERLPGLSGELLALSIDPATPSPWPMMRPARIVRFENQGRQSTMMIEHQIVDYIRRLRFETAGVHSQKFHIMSAIADFERRGIDIGGKSRVHAIWKAYEQIIESASRN